MFDALLALDLLLTVLIPIAWLLAGWSVGRLARRPTLGGLRRGATAALVLLVPAVLLTLASVGPAAGFWLGAGWWVAQDRVLVTLPVVLIPAAAAVALTVPGLVGLCRAGRGDRQAAVRPELAARAAGPAIVVPAQAAAVGGALGTWFTWFHRPVAGNLTSSALLAATVTAAAAAALWARQRARARAAGGAGPRPVGAGTRLVRVGGVLLVVVAGTVGAYSSAAAASRLPARLSMSDGGTVDLGGGAPIAHAGRGGPAGVAVPDLRERDLDGPVRRFTLTARNADVRLSSGRVVSAMTFDGTSPGPELRVRQGDLVEVTLANADIAGGVTIHWHGVDLPNAADGVAGVTQDAVLPGQRSVYRFKADQVGTFWYHSHQHSAEQVDKGLFGALVIEPRQAPPARTDLAVVMHDWALAPGPGAGDQVDQGRAEDGERGPAVTAFNGADTLQRRKVAPGTPVRLRLVNADSGSRTVVLAGTPYRVAAIDGTDLNRPGELTGQRLHLAGGGRYDLTFTMPPTPVLLTTAGRAGAARTDVAGLLLSADGVGEPPAPADGPEFDPIGYGLPAATPFGASSRFDRSFSVTLDIGFGFFDGQPVGVWKINGRSFPDTPMQMVREGELVKVTLVNRSLAEHPMHLHGHHMLVLSRDGRPSTGSPWWSDTLNVAPGERYEVAFRADNPGLWMDHCHNLEHATVGMTMHLAYEGVHSPYQVGHATPNQPE